MIKNCMKRDVVSIPATATIREAASQMAERHIGLLPVVDYQGKLIGVIGLPELLSLEMPAFFYLISDLDFVSDFGAVETTRPTPEQVDQPVTALMQPARSVAEDSGMLHAYGLMLKHNLSDLPVVSEVGQLVGVVSRVDIGAVILSAWKEIEASKP
jgi:CBS domain-containing protein